MVDFSNSVQIRRPIDEVFAFVSNLEHTPEWNWAISETRKVSPGPVGIGTRYIQSRTTPRREEEVLEITNLVTDQAIEVEGTLARMPARLTYQFDQGPDGTTLTNTVTLEPEGPLRMLSPILTATIRRAVAENLQVLKQRLERQST